MLSGIFGPRQASSTSTTTTTTNNLLLDQGHLFVPEAYYQVSGDAAIQLDSADDWIATKIVPECDYKLTSISVYTTALATEGNRTLEIYSHDSTNNKPNASLQVLGTLGSGADADAWTRLVIDSANQYQLYAGKTYWIVCKGADSKDWSESIRRWNTAQGSMFPDSMIESKYTTDGGSSYTSCTQDSKPALWNIILNSQEDGVPYLGFGRKDGRYIVLPGDEIVEIDVEGIFYDCSGLTANTLYYVYIYDNGGTLTLLADTTEWTVDSDSFRVMTGETSRKFIGIIYPKDILGGGYQAPIDVMDRRLVAFPGMNKSLGKLCPYAAATSDSGVSTSWEKLNNNSTDFDADFLVMPGGGKLSCSINAIVTASLYYNLSIFVDGLPFPTDPAISSSIALNVGYYVKTHGNIDEGKHTISPMQYTGTADSTGTVAYYNASASLISSYSNLLGEISM